MGENAGVGWWRRNTWALLALPVVLAIVVVSGLGRVLLFWLPHEFTDRVETTIGRAVTFTDDYTDVNGTHERTVELSVLRVTPGAEPTTSAGETAVGEGLLPDGTQVWEVELAVRADPETVLTGCVVALVDAEGRIAQRDTSLMTWDTAMSACEPADTTNPSAILYDGFRSDPSTRPPTYTQSVQLLTADDFEPVEIRVWWEPPTYLAVPVPAVGR